MKARTIPWESIADWYKENEQTIRDVMKFEGLRGAVNEVLRLSPEQPELAALREELAGANRRLGACINQIEEQQQRLTAAEQRNAEGSAAMQLATKLLDQTLSALNPRNSLAYEVRHFLAAHRKTKPTESGASE